MSMVYPPNPKKLLLSYFFNDLLNIIIDNTNQNIVNNAINPILVIVIFFTISTGIAPSNSDGTKNTNIFFRIPENAPPWYKDTDTNIWYNPIDTFSPSIK